MSAFLNQWQAELRSKVPLVLWLVISAVIAVSGPFGSYGSLGLLERIVFWTPIAGVGVLTSSAIRTYVALHERRFPPGIALVISTVLVCLVLCPLLYLLTTSMFVHLSTGPSRFIEIVALVATVSLGAAALRQALAEENPAVAPPAIMQVEESRLMRRLEPCQRGALVAISVRDHYVDVQTADGTASLLMRPGDAIAEAAPVDGAQVHRSHWVAWAAVRAVERDGTKLFLSLTNGARVPVSKNHRSKLAERGLI